MAVFLLQMSLLNRLLLMLLLLALLLLLGARSQTKENIMEAREHVSPRALALATTASIAMNAIDINLRRMRRPVELQRARGARDACAPAGALDGHRAPRARTHRVGEEDAAAAESVCTMDK